MKFSELKTKSEKELQDILKDNVEKLRGFRFDIAFNKLKDVSKIKKTKKLIARIKTLLNKK